MLATWGVWNTGLSCGVFFFFMSLSMNEGLIIFKKVSLFQIPYIITKTDCFRLSSLLFWLAFRCSHLCVFIVWYAANANVACLWRRTEFSGRSQQKSRVLGLVSRYLKIKILTVNFQGDLSFLVYTSPVAWWLSSLSSEGFSRVCLSVPRGSQEGQRRGCLEPLPRGLCTKCSSPRRSLVGCVKWETLNQVKWK